jgi:copper chaperone NosL
MTRLLLTLTAVIALAGCSQGPEPIRWGTDTCDQCRMVLSDRAYGAEFVDERGKISKFDEVSELAAWLAANPTKGEAYVTNGVDGTLVPAATATYLHTKDLIGPMGGNTMSFADRQAGEAFVIKQKLKNVQWLAYADALQAEQPAGQPGGHDHGSH